MCFQILVAISFFFLGMSNGPLPIFLLDYGTFPSVFRSSLYIKDYIYIGYQPIKIELAYVFAIQVLLLFFFFKAGKCFNFLP